MLLISIFCLIVAGFLFFWRRRSLRSGMRVSALSFFDYGPISKIITRTLDFNTRKIYDQRKTRVQSWESNGKWIVEDSIVDLHDIALLLNYERASTEPRFRYAKLREVATPGHDFQTLFVDSPEWYSARIPRTGLVFEKATPWTPQGRKEADLPSNMLPASPSPALRALSPAKLETYYWQARNHDGCYTTIAAFQHFMDLFPPSASLRIRDLEEPNNKVRDYITSAASLYIIEMNLISPRSMNMSLMLPSTTSYTTGSEYVSPHAVLGFAAPDASAISILDLSSLQFGEVGRGFKTKGLFVLEPIEQYRKRLGKYAVYNNFSSPQKISSRINTASVPNNEWLKDVAKRAKARWDDRDNVPWCGHCGAPPRSESFKRCTKCQRAWYCDEEHQRAAWPYHKHFCALINQDAE